MEHEIIDLTLDDDDDADDDETTPQRQGKKQKSQPRMNLRQKPLIFPPTFPKSNLRRVVISSKPEESTSSTSYLLPKVKDYKLGPLLAAFQRPYFSPFFDSYEMDYVMTGKLFDEKHQALVQNYLFVVNINTKYLVSVPLPMGEAPSIERTIQAFDIVFQKLAPNKIDSLRGDADAAFGNTDFDMTLSDNNDTTPKSLSRNQQRLVNYLKSKGVNRLFLSSSKFTNKNRCVDRVIRTIRDLAGLKMVRLLNPEIVDHLIEIYNNTPHSAYLHKFTPADVQGNPEIEGAYIRYQKQVLDDIKEQQRRAGLDTYKPGNILLVYIPKDKTPQKFDKRRRNFSDLATFIAYKNGNVLCELLDGLLFPNPVVLLPIHFTKYVSEDIYTLPPTYREVFLIRKAPTPTKTSQKF